MGLRLFFICHIYTPFTIVLHRYILDGMSALAWELLFPKCLPHKKLGVQLSAIHKDTTSELGGLFSTISHKCRTPTSEAMDTIF